MPKQNSDIEEVDVHVERLGSNASRKSEEKMRLWEAVTRHAVAFLLLFAAIVVTPALLIVLVHAGGDDAERFKSAMEFLRVWFSAIAGLAGTAIGAYFIAGRVSTKDRDRGA